MPDTNRLDKMTNFTYCYLSPFMVGLLAFALVVIAFLAVCFVISKTYNWVIYGVSPASLLRKNIDRVVAFSNKWVIPVLVGGFCIFIVLLLAFGAWDIGITILKRFACR